MHRTIVSGITGHLGSELARQLIAAGVEVHGLTRGNASLHSSSNVQLHHIDGSTPSVITAVEEAQPEVVFHLAGLARRSHQSADVSPFVDTNILFGAQLLEAARLCHCPHIITAGTYLQQFNGDEGGAMNLYAATKQAFEVLMQYYVDAFDMSAVRLTLCDIYSERDTRHKLMTDIATAWAGNSPLTLLNGDAALDLLHSEDAARAFLQVAALLESHSIQPRGVVRYSVSSGQEVTVPELISAFERIAGRKLTVHSPTSPRLSRDMAPWRGTQVPGWAPRISLEEGIARIIATRR